jgi:hypothetical protein
MKIKAKAGDLAEALALGRASESFACLSLSPLCLLLEVDGGERVLVGIADDEALPIELRVGSFDGLWRREAARAHRQHPSAASPRRLSSATATGRYFPMCISKPQAAPRAV